MVMPNHVHGLIIGETCAPETKGKDFFSLMC
jgi:hypothetical protein